MKYYENGFVAQKVKAIHRELENIQFPYHIPLVENEEKHIIKQFWFEGKNAEYKRFEHQQLSLHAIEKLHETCEVIPWAETGILSTYRLEEKWKRRFERFIHHER